MNIIETRYKFDAYMIYNENAQIMSFLYEVVLLDKQNIIARWKDNGISQWQIFCNWIMSKIEFTIIQAKILVFHFCSANQGHHTINFLVLWSMNYHNNKMPPIQPPKKILKVSNVQITSIWNQLFQRKQVLIRYVWIDRI